MYANDLARQLIGDDDTLVKVCFDVGFLRARQIADDLLDYASKLDYENSPSAALATALLNFFENAEIEVLSCEQYRDGTEILVEL